MTDEASVNQVPPVAQRWSVGAWAGLSSSGRIPSVTITYTSRSSATGRAGCAHTGAGSASSVTPTAPAAATMPAPAIASRRVSVVRVHGSSWPCIGRSSGGSRTGICGLPRGPRGPPRIQGTRPRRVAPAHRRIVADCSPPGPPQGAGSLGGVTEDAGLFAAGDAGGAAPPTPVTEAVDPSAPLAVRMRPRSLDEVIGQDHLLRPNSPLR